MSTRLEHTPKKALFLALSGIGNILMQLPTIRLFKSKYPTTHVTVWVAPRGTRELVDAEKAIDAVIEAPIRRSLVLQGMHMRRLQREHFDTGIMLSPGQLWKGSLYMLLGGMDTRIGHQYPHLGNETSSFLLTHTVPEREALHDIEQNARLLTLFGVPESELVDLGYSLDIPNSNRDEADGLLKALKLAPERPLIAMHPGSAMGFEWKRWSLDRFAELGKRLVDDHNAFILIFGGREEAALKKQLRSTIGKRDSSIQMHSLLTSAALLKRCNTLISNDSGLMHLGAAVGTATVGLFGPTDERLTGPRGVNCVALRAQDTQPSYNTEGGVSEMGTGHKTLDALSIQHVYDAVVPLIR